VAKKMKVSETTPPEVSILIRVVEYPVVEYITDE
jgi:hypothetical protein